MRVTLGRSLARGFAFGLALSVLTAWPIAAVVTTLVDSREWTDAEFLALRLAHQLVMWSVGGVPAGWLLRRGTLERSGAMVMAASPLLFDATTALAFGLWPLVIGTWAERAVAAVVATALWVLFSRAPRRTDRDALLSRSS